MRYVAGREDWFASGLPREGTKAQTPRAADVARRDVPTCRVEDDLKDVRERVRAAGWDTCIAINEDGVVLGRLRKHTLEGEGESSVEAAMDPGPASYRPNVPIATMLDRLREAHAASTLITTSDGVLLGVLYRKDAERAAGKTRAPEGRERPEY